MNGKITAKMMIKQLENLTNLELQLIKLICDEILDERKGEEE